MVRYSFLVRLFHPLLHAGLIPALSLITLSARANTFGGIVKPICLAAFRLITNSNFVGASIGKSAGLAPFRICPHKWRRADTEHHYCPNSS
jgi:hypothetical protein